MIQIARYGEIQKNTFVKAGDRVEAGQPIAKGGKLLSIRNSMLHLELYDKSATGPLTVKGNATIELRRVYRSCVAPI